MVDLVFAYATIDMVSNVWPVNKSKCKDGLQQAGLAWYGLFVVDDVSMGVLTNSYYTRLL